ncbi:acetyltransferase (GNAT) family protein [Kribbella amoyensis]|uniref:Acetyltransferase (GNAT) family protein n=1 Tax=Kribbella amoyensis TaxID=996641 RepID=A0A561BV37_9ACTN|nr:GNAT family N-acetyltransferase [Kribbella amoyensis]TWD82756.1 acetyltransferase (GNAT) family protein [Kribbella amoyensis]
MSSEEVQLVEFDDGALPPLLKYQVLSFLRIVWPDGFTGSLRHRDWITNPEYDPHHMLYIAGDLVVSHLEVVHRDVTPEGVTYRAYAPTSVLTFPPFRREGWAGKLVEKASRWIEESDADLGLICCEPESQGFYARNSGWDPVPEARIVVGDDKTRAELTPQVLLACFLTEKSQQHRETFGQAPLWLKDEL